MLRTVIVILLFAVYSQAKSQKREEDAVILFTKQKPGGNDELVTLIDGDLKWLTKHPAKDSSPSLSPDGEKIVFTSERKGWWKIWIYDLVSDSIEQLTNSSSAEYAPSFSPDGRKIVFTSQRSGKSDLYIMNSDGSSIQNLTNNESSVDAAHWANDNYIYYASNESGQYQIYRIRPSGKGRELLSDGKSDDLGPKLSPDGASVLFYSYRFGNPEICTMNLTTRKVNRLTNDSLLDIRPNWSPDGNKIVFERGNKKDNQQIWLMNRDGSDQVSLTKDGYHYSPAYGVNSQHIKRVKAK